MLVRVRVAGQDSAVELTLIETYPRLGDLHLRFGDDDFSTQICLSVRAASVSIRLCQRFLESRVQHLAASFFQHFYHVRWVVVVNGFQAHPQYCAVSQHPRLVRVVLHDCRGIDQDVLQREQFW